MAVAEHEGHDVVTTHDCSTPGCPRIATRRGPGGRPFCEDCHRRIYAKKNATTTERHGTIGGGGLAKALTTRDRADAELDELTRRLRTEAKAFERALGRPEKAAAAKRELADTVRAIAQRVAQLEHLASQSA